jgi:hypothetical protein
VIGRYLTNQQYGCTVVASMPEARDGKANPKPIGGGLFIPRFRNLRKDEKRSFNRGYALPLNTGSSPDPKYFPEYGEEARQLCWFLHDGRHLRRRSAAL